MEGYAYSMGRNFSIDRFSDKICNEPIFILVGVIISLIIYFLPTIMTKRDRWGMFVFNLLSGWSGFGWVVCMSVCLWGRAQQTLKEGERK